MKPAQPVSKSQPPKEVPVTAAEELLCALLLADPGLSTAPGAEAVEEIGHLGVRGLVELAAKGEELTELWGALEPALAKRIQRKRGEILTRWPSEPNRREAVAHAAREVRLHRVEERLAELKKEFASLSEADLASEDTRVLLEEQQRLRELRTRLTAPPDPEGGTEPESAAR